MGYAAKASTVDTTSSPADAARSLRGLLESEADAVEAAGTLTAPVVDALEQTGLFKLMVPESLGGHEAGPEVIFDVCEELSYAEGSVGWACAQNCAVSSFVAFVEPEVAERFAGLRTGAGMFAPLGVAHEEHGRYRVSGSFKFGSGSGHAQYMGGSAVLMRDGEIAPIGDDGAFPVVGFLVPEGSYELKRDWDVIGLRGTGSYDFEIPEQTVEAGATWRMFQRGAAKHPSGGAVYGLGPVPLATLVSEGWLIGVGRRALWEIKEIVTTQHRTRLGQTPLLDQQIFQRDFGLHHTALSAARAYGLKSFQDTVAAIDAGAPALRIESLLRAARSAANHMAKIAVEAVDFAWNASGSAGIRNTSRLQRCFRDIHTGAGHMVFDDRNYVETAKEQLGLEVTIV